MDIIHRIAPADVIVIIRNIVNGTIVEVEVGVVIPWPPFIAADISIDDTYFW
jgi:hypothetical protein